MILNDSTPYHHPVFLLLNNHNVVFLMPIYVKCVVIKLIASIEENVTLLVSTAILTIFLLIIGCQVEIINQMDQLHARIAIVIVIATRIRRFLLLADGELWL